MIEAEMYGMMPRAKTVARCSAPPVNRSSRPNRLFWPPTASTSASRSMPGSVMCAPIRSRTSTPSVKRIFRRSSGILKRFGTCGVATDLALLLAANADRAAGRLDRLAGGRAERVGLDRHRARQAALGQHLHRAAVGIDETQRGQPLER